MNRTSQHPAVVIHTIPFGESHLWADVLTRDAGLVRAAAYGAAAMRGSLRGRVVPFAVGTLRLYRRGDNLKITEFDVEGYRSSIRESIDAFYHASLWAEVVRKSHGGGSADANTFDLVVQGMGLLDHCAGNQPEYPWSADGFPYVRLTVQWLWRYAYLLGVQPDVPSAATGGAAFRPGDHGFVEPMEGVSRFVVGERSIAYLRHTSTMALTDAIAVPLRRETAQNLLGFSLLFAEDIAQDRLNTVHTGAAVFTV